MGSALVDRRRTAIDPVAGTQRRHDDIDVACSGLMSRTCVPTSHAVALLAAGDRGRAH
jgi:hypothetical protein